MDNFRDSYFNVTWDLTKKHLRGTFWGKQYDTGRGFAVTVINGGQVVTPSTEVLRLKWEKPDNTTGYVNATIVNGKFVIENIDQMFTVHGSVRADFELSVAGEFVASITFYVNVEKAVAVDSIESSSDFSAFQQSVADFSAAMAGFTSLTELAHLVSEFVQTGDLDDTLSINRALAYVDAQGGGKVRIPWRSTPYIISSELVIGSNTTLEVDESATIKLADGSNCVMLWNKNKTTQANKTIIDKNITVTGGIWDGNRAGQTLKWYGAQNTSQLIVGIHFSGVENLKFHPNKIINTRTYGLMLNNFKNADIRNIDINVGIMTEKDNGDGIHVMGPGEKLVIDNIAVKSEDHAIAINCDDVGHGPYTTTGSIKNVLINNITLNNDDGGQGLNLLSGVSSLKDVTIRDIKGKAAYLLGMHTFDMGAGDFDNILVENTNVEVIGTFGYEYVHMFGKYGKIKFKNINMPKINTVTNNFRIRTRTGTPVTTIDELVLEEITCNGVNLPAASNYAVVQLSAGVDINILKLIDFRSEFNITPVLPLDVSSTKIKKLIIDRAIIDYAMYGIGYFYLNEIEYISVNELRLGTKSNNVFHNAGGLGNRTRRLVYTNSGLPFIKFDTYVDSVYIDDKTKDQKTDDSFYIKDHIVFRTGVTDYAGWICTAKGSRLAQNWAANTTYEVDAIVRLNTWVLKCVQAGTSGAVVPTVTEPMFMDGTVKWLYLHNGIASFKAFGAIAP